MPKALVLSQLRDELAAVEATLGDDGLPFTVRRMWEARRQELQETLRAEEGRTTGLASVALSFEGEPVIGRSAIDVEFSSRALDSFQALVSNIYAEALTHVAGRGPVRHKTDSRLFIQDVLHGSMGFVLSEKPIQGEAFPTPLSDAVERALILLDKASSNEESEFDSLLAEVSPRTIVSLRRMVEIIHNAQATAKVSSDTQSRNLDRIRVDRMFVRLNNSVKAEEGVLYNGLLGGIFPDREEFEFLIDEDNVVIHGSVSREIIYQYVNPDFRSRYINTPVTAQFTRTSIHRPGQADATRFILDHVFDRRPAAIAES